MTKENRISLKDFKDKYALNMSIDGVYDWYSYIIWCKSNGFDESEIGYDDLIMDYALFRLQNNK